MPRGTDRLAAVGSRAVVTTALALAGLAGCRREPSGTEPTISNAVSGVPPLDKFTVSVDLSPADGAPPPAPPESALEPFRLWINQETPRQKKNPEWRSIPAREGSVVEMAPDGKWRCLVNPAQVFGKSDDDAKIAFWTQSRVVRCSSDQWATYVEGLVRVGYTPDGQRSKADPSAALYLKDTVNGQPRVTVVVLEAAASPRDGGK